MRFILDEVRVTVKVTVPQNISLFLESWLSVNWGYKIGVGGVQRQMCTISSRVCASLVDIRSASVTVILYQHSQKGEIFWMNNRKFGLRSSPKISLFLEQWLSVNWGYKIGLRGPQRQMYCKQSSVWLTSALPPRIYKPINVFLLQWV